MSQLPLTAFERHASPGGVSQQTQTAPDLSGTMADLDPDTLRDSEALREELRRTRRELDRALDRRRQVMELIGCNAPDKLIHDMRNVMNEIQLLKILAANEI